MKSEKLFAASLKKMPGGVNSPIRAWKGIGRSPFVVARGEGDLLIDVDGKRYIDYCGSFGALLLGHAPPPVVRAVSKQIKKGSSFALPTEVELQAATLITEAMPSIEKIRFVSSGTEAVMSSIRLARGVTQKSCIVKFDGNYHGHCDALLVQSGSGTLDLGPTATSAGIPEQVIHTTLSLPYNDIESVRKLLRSRKDIAAVIVEPIAGNMGVVPAEPSFLQALREETRQNGALLIFDEVITGFRVGWGGAQALYGIEPDLTCLGKIIGGGYPAAAFGGKKKWMDHLAPLGEVYQAGTLSGNPVALTAGIATLREAKKRSFYKRLEAKTRLLTDPLLEEIAKRSLPLHLSRVGSMFTLFFDRETFNAFFMHMLKCGIYVPPAPFEASFVSEAHTEKHLQKTSKAIIDFLKKRFA